MNKIKPIDVRQSASDLTTQRMSMSQKNPATGNSWFETPSAEYQAYEKQGLTNDLNARKTQGDQDIEFTRKVITDLRPKANNEANRALGMDLKTKFPYMQYETETASGREIMNNAQQAIPTFLNRATASRLNPVSMSL